MKGYTLVLSTVGFYFLLATGCATHHLNTHAGSVEAALTVNNTNEAFIHEDHLYICFDGSSKTFERTRKPNIVTEYADRVLVFNIKKGITRLGNFYESALFDSLLDKDCGEVKGSVGAVSELTVLEISKKLVCKPLKPCSNLVWEAKSGEVVLLSGEMDDSVSFDDSSVARVVAEQIKQLLPHERALLDSKRTFSRSGDGGDTSNYFYYYQNNRGSSGLNTSRVEHEEPAYPLYALTPATVAWDIITFPVQAVLVLIVLNP